jgi:hypothetical protein
MRRYVGGALTDPGDHTMRRTFPFALALFAGASLLTAASPTGKVAAPAKPAFTDVKAQTEEFLRYEQAIRLTPQQEAVKREALSALPAPCCSDKTLYTCCCPCHMAKTAWGLANYLIARQGYGVEQTRAKVSEWIQFINPAGFPGDTCYQGGCARPFAKAGCGGMSAPVVF